MSQGSDVERNRFLLTNLGILLIFIFTLVVILAAYPLLLAPEPTLTPTITPTRTITPTITQTPTITLTPSPSRTPRPTATPTITLTPSRTLTPTLTPTPTGPATLTAAVPAPGSVYRLQPWSPELAAAGVALLDNYPNTLLARDRGADNSGYYAAFYPATIAQREALLRFPTAAQAERWRWGLAYNLARLGDERSAEHYSMLIEEALNKGGIAVDGLVEWFSVKEPRFRISLQAVSPGEEGQAAWAARLDGSGSALLYIHQGRSQFRVYPATTQFDFIKRPEYSSLAGDITGDSLDELILYQVQPNGNLPLVFSLESLPPEALSFHPSSANFSVGTDYTGEWRVEKANGSINELVFSAELFPACPLKLERRFVWDGDWLQPLETTYQLAPVAQTLSYCRYMVEHAASLWGPATAADLAETLLPDWPPASDENGKPFPADERDRWRFRLGVYRAAAGQSEEARQTMQEIVQSPSTASSEWVEKAQVFLEAYTSSTDGFYRACLQADFCQPAWALQQLAASLQLETHAALLQALWDAGVRQRASGYFDFDGDGQDELWLTVQHRPGEILEFWIFFIDESRIGTLNLGEIESSRPALEIYQEGEPPSVLLENRRAFRVVRPREQGEPYLQPVELPRFYPNRFNLGLEMLIDDLFAGKPPAQVLRSLLALQESPGLLCTGDWSCDRYFYMVGLAAELSGDKNAAIENYLWVWRNHSRSPYTTLARLKLSGRGLQPTATETPLISETPTTTLTPGTPTPTVTGTPPTATTTPTPTETENPYPFGFTDTPIPTETTNPYPTP